MNGDDLAVSAAKNAELELIDRRVMPLMPLLLRSFDPATVGTATGSNALHEMCSLFSFENAEYWPYKLCQLLINRGVNVHSRNKSGCTPLLQRAAHCCCAGMSSTNGMRLLLLYGADLNAQDGDGNDVLHLLILCGAAAEARLADLLGGGGVAHFDFALRNNAGHTAADLAAIRLAKQADSSADSPAKRIHRLMLTQDAMWVKP